MIDCLLADMDCLDCPVGACSRERAEQTDNVGVSPRCSVALPSWFAFDVILQGQGVASLEGWSTGCVGRVHLVPAAGERPPRALGLDLSLPSGMMHVPGTVRGWILPPWEGGPVRLPSCQTLIACHGEAASPIVGRAVDAPIPEVSFSCLLILLQLASWADM